MLGLQTPCICVSPGTQGTPGTCNHDLIGPHHCPGGRSWQQLSSSLEIHEPPPLGKCPHRARFMPDDRQVQERVAFTHCDNIRTGKISKETQRERSSIRAPTWSQWPRAGQAGRSKQEFHGSLLCGWQGSLRGNRPKCELKNASCESIMYRLHGFELVFLEESSRRIFSQVTSVGWIQDALIKDALFSVQDSWRSA